MHTLALIFAIPVFIALCILQIKKDSALPDFAAVAIIALIMTLYYAF
jgi:hypothetical protein